MELSLEEKKRLECYPELGKALVLCQKGTQMRQVAQDQPEAKIKPIPRPKPGGLKTPLWASLQIEPA